MMIKWKINIKYLLNLISLFITIGMATGIAETTL